jgi:signal transduction histidine kinase
MNNINGYLIKLILSFYALLFSMSILIIYLNYSQNINNLHNNIFQEMKTCNLNLECKKEYDINVIEEKHPINQLIFTDNLLQSYFKIKDTEYLLEISIKDNIYKDKVFKIYKNNMYLFILLNVILITLSLYFAKLSIQPIKKVFKNNEEFIKDFLHDINTPLTALKMNVNLLERKIDIENKNIGRIKDNISNIENLQIHLKSFIYEFAIDIKTINLIKEIQTIIDINKKTYPDIKVVLDKDSLDIRVTTYKEGFLRIISNIISNAFKYNKVKGNIKIYMEENILYIEDTGIGIKDKHKIYERYYKENERGMGLGLNIVKKLSEELNINIDIDTKLNEYTIFKLDLNKMIGNQ